MEVTDRKEGREHIALTVDILWQIWKARNTVEFEDKERHPMKVITKVVMEWEEYLKSQQPEQQVSISETDIADVQEQRVVEDTNTLTISVHVGQHLEGLNMGIGITAENRLHQLSAVWLMKERSTGSPILDNLVAIRLALCKLMERGCFSIKLQTPSLQVYKLLNGQVSCNMLLAAHIQYITDLSLMFTICSFDFQSANHSINCLSHKLSKQAMHLHFDEEFFDPQCLSTLL
nr:uncharacterized protein LOC113704482 [Coffea arabica]XP_027082186.1 uncharacterized protein LOC113704484 [Coffea arabica]